MNTKLRWLICIAIIPLVLSGCANVMLVDRSNSLVMPDHVARKILAKYFGDEWVENPYLNTMTNPFCKSVKVPVKFSEIKMVSYLPGPMHNVVALYDNYLLNLRPPLFSCDVLQKQYSVKVSNESDAQQITEALIALGTPIKGYVKVY